MSWSSVQSKLQFYSSGAWTLSPDPQAAVSASTDAQKTLFLEKLQHLYEHYPTAAKLLDDAADKGPIRIGMFGPNTPGFNQPQSSFNPAYFGFNLDAIQQTYFISDEGTLVKNEIEVVIAHEFDHYVNNSSDPVYDPIAMNGMLVFDRDHDGTVSGAGELSFIDDKPGAKSDLDGLSAFDSNHDGQFSALDSTWADFRVWRDSDGNGEVGPGEFLTMEAAGVAAISLHGNATEQSWGMTDNILVNEGSFLRTDGSGGALADVALNYFAATPFFRHLMADAVRAEQDYAPRAGEGHAVLPFFAADQAALDALPTAFALPAFHAADEAALRSAADPSGLA
jgi:hypothetical protein